MHDGWKRAVRYWLEDNVCLQDTENWSPPLASFWKESLTILNPPPTLEQLSPHIGRD